jgi:hypothetical protein
MMYNKGHCSGRGSLELPRFSGRPPSGRMKPATAVYVHESEVSTLDPILK